MNIVLTNDDGIHSQGLKTLEKSLQTKHDVWVLAPDTERSAASHSITIHNPMRIKKIGDRSWACGGTPADCSILALLGVVPVKPDLVISGINRGPNLGTDIIYSGTVAAARQAAFMGYPGIAVSLNTYTEPFYFDPVADFVAKNIDSLVKLWHPDHFVNINAPNDAAGYKGVRITHPSRRIYHDKLARFEAPDGNDYYFLYGSEIDAQVETGSDWEAVSGGCMSVSPVFLHPINHAEDLAYRTMEFAI
ncbi:MAG: 5'/3'-nucleotidase SurE [Spirochaetales bacterium]|nr:5'/3'-nucleotidase SurE [Spirochaetales bacterium]